MLASRFAAVWVRTANRHIPRGPDGALPQRWLLVEWPSSANAPTDYWLVILSEDTAIDVLVRLGKIGWRIKYD